MARLLPGKRHVWLPPPVRVRKVTARGAPRAVFMGVRHGGNQDALELILAEIWPAVRRALPEAELWVVGEIGDDLLDPPEGVRLIRRVEDTAEIGGPDAVGLAPIRAASGVSIKIASYLELGMSVLASPKALEGYGAALDDLVVQAEDPAEFSAKLIALLSDTCLREETAQRSAENVAARVTSQQFERYLRELEGGRRRLAAVPTA